MDAVVIPVFNEEKTVKKIIKSVSNYYWLRNGNTLCLLKEHYHFHRKRQDSVSWTEKENSKISRNHFDKHILELSLRSLNSIKRKNSLVSKLNKLYKPIRSKLFRAYFSVLKVFNIFWFFSI